VARTLHGCHIGVGGTSLAADRAQNSFTATNRAAAEPA
jgi:hypothetical protein